MEKDQDITKTDFIDQVLKVMEHNEKLYYITPGFGISTAVGRASLLKEKGSMGLKEMEEIVSQQSGSRQMRVVYRETREGMLRHLCREIDRNFAGMSHEDLKEWLEAAGQLSIETEKTSLLEAVKNKEFLLMTDVCLEFNDILIYERMFGEEVVFAGYPFQGGEGNELSRMVSATEEYADQDGNNVRPYHCEMTYDDVEVVMNKEEENKFWDLVGSIKYEETWNGNIWSIVDEEAEKYFSGEKSLEEAVDSIEERVKLYFDEMN